MDNFILFMCVAYVVGYIIVKIQRKWQNRPVEKEIVVTEYSMEMTSNEKRDIQDAWDKWDVNSPGTNERLISELVNEVLSDIPPKNEISDAKSALKTLGYKNKDIDNAVDAVIKTIGCPMKSGEIITSALRILNA